MDVTIGQGEGEGPIKVPVTAQVPNNTKMQDVQLCSSMKEGKQSCQSLKDFMPKSSSETSEKSEKGPSESNETSEESTNGPSDTTDNGND